MAQNKLVAELQQRIHLLEQWQREATLIIDPILEYGQRHPDCKLGSSITSFVLERCKQYDDLKALYDQMDAETTKKASTYAAEAYERLHKRYEEVKGKADAYERALILIKEQAENGIFPHLPIETVGAAMCLGINNLATEVLLTYNASTTSTT